jgi:hypothetical protein
VDLKAPLNLSDRRLPTPEQLKDPKPMSHDDFVLGYQSGRLGCSVSALLFCWLFVSGRTRQRRVATALVRRSLGLLLLVGLSIVGFVYLPPFWAILASLIMLTLFTFGSIQRIAELVVSAALADEQFYDFARAQRVLSISNDVEANLLNLQKVVPIRPPRRAQR